MFSILGGVVRDLRELGDMALWLINAVTTPETDNVVQYHLPTQRSPIELLGQNARDGNIEIFYPRFQSIISQTPPLSLEQFNPNIYIQTLLLNIKTTDAQTVIALNKLYNSFNSAHIIPKINTIIATLNMEQLELLKECVTFYDQITARQQILIQEDLNKMGESTYGPDVLSEADQFVLVCKGDATHTDNIN